MSSVILDESPGYIISGHAVLPKLLNELNAPNENEGIVYAAEYIIPPRTKENLNNLNLQSFYLFQL